MRADANKVDVSHALLAKNRGKAGVPALPQCLKRLASCFNTFYGRVAISQEATSRKSDTKAFMPILLQTAGNRSIWTNMLPAVMHILCTAYSSVNCSMCAVITHADLTAASWSESTVQARQDHGHHGYVCKPICEMMLPVGMQAGLQGHAGRSGRC